MGETRAERSRRKKRRLAGGGGGGVRRVSRSRSTSTETKKNNGNFGPGSGLSLSSEDGSASEGDGGVLPSDDASGDDDGWVDPVTRAVVEPLEEEEEGDTPLSSGDEEFGVHEQDQQQQLTQPSISRLPDSTFSFRLRSAEKHHKKNTISMTATYDNRNIPSHISTSILSNPIPPQFSSSIINSTSKLRKQARLLPNPMMTSLLDPSVPSTRSVSPVPSLSSSSSSKNANNHANHLPRLHQTPFHLPKTLILDLDETLIHSTSRPLAYAGLQGGVGSGGGLLGLSFGGMLGGGKRRGEGHQVEVVLNGRSTMYHVYKRPYVDHFLKKVGILLLLVVSPSRSCHPFIVDGLTWTDSFSPKQVASWYTLVIFTASMPEYADPVIDWLDGGRGLFAKKLYRESCSLQPNGSYIKDLSLVEKDLSRVCFMDNSPVSYNWNKGEDLSSPAPLLSLLLFLSFHFLPLEAYHRTVLMASLWETNV